MSKLRQLRDEAGLSRHKLAVASGVSYYNIVYWEINDTNPKLEDGKKLASALAGPLGRSWETVLGEMAEDSEVAA